MSRSVGRCIVLSKRYQITHDLVNTKKGVTWWKRTKIAFLFTVDNDDIDLIYLQAEDLSDKLLNWFNNSCKKQENINAVSYINDVWLPEVSFFVNSCSVPSVSFHLFQIGSIPFQIL